MAEYRVLFQHINCSSYVVSNAQNTSMFFFHIELNVVKINSIRVTILLGAFYFFGNISLSSAVFKLMGNKFSVLSCP